MDLFGTTRSRVAGDHALICPDSFVRSPLPGWARTEGILLIAPPLGARFTQYLALMEAGATASPPAAGVERVVYVLEGSVMVSLPGGPARTLDAGGFAFVPAGTDCPIRAATAARLNVFEKRFAPLTGTPTPIVG